MYSKACASTSESMPWASGVEDRQPCVGQYVSGSAVEAVRSPAKATTTSNVSTKKRTARGTRFTTASNGRGKILKDSLAESNDSERSRAHSSIFASPQTTHSRWLPIHLHALSST